MDKKYLPGRLGKAGVKARANQPVGGLIALGQRSDTPDPAGRSKAVTGFGSKRPVQDVGVGQSAASVPSLKKPRLDFSQGLAAPSSSVPPPAASSQNQFSAAPARRDPINDDLWRDLAISISELNPKELVAKVGAAEERLKTTKIPKYLCAALKQLLERRASGRAEPMLTVGLAYLSKKNGAHFQHSAVAEGLCALIRAPSITAGQPRPNKSFDLSLFGISLFHNSFEDSADWPLTVVKVFIDDSLADRMWVDRPECARFVANILTAFDTDIPSEALLVAAELPGPPVAAAQQNSKSPSVERELDANESRDALDVAADVERPIRPRFEKKKDEAANWTLTILRDWWSRRVDTAPKALLRTMASCCGLQEVRLSAAQKLDVWLSNTKLQKQAMELLLAVCVNFSEPKTQTDLEILSCLLKLRALKSKPVMAGFCLGLREILSNHVDNLEAIMRLSLNNEFSTTRSQYSIPIIHQCFLFDNKKACEALGVLFCDLLRSKKDDYLRSLRAFLREFVRSYLRADFSFSAFGRALLNASEALRDDVECPKERTFNAIIDLICMLGFLGVTSSVKDCFQARKGSAGEPLRRYYTELSDLTKAAIVWLQSTAAAVFAPPKELYVRAFYRICYIDKPEFFSSTDLWPTDADRAFYLRIVSEGPVDEEVLMTPLSTSLSAAPIDPTDAVDFVEQLTKRAALAAINPFWSEKNDTPLRVSRFDAIDLLFDTVAYRPPPNLLPKEYIMPSIAVTALYWKAWTVLLIWAAHNRETIGKALWENYPTLRYMMQMMMTNDHHFPPFAAGSDEKPLEAITAEDAHEAVTEKAVILELETHLAGQPMTEQSSHLLTLVCSLNPKGPGRKPSQLQLEELQRLNAQMHLGMMMCKCRQPDFLLDVISRQGASRSLPWLIRLIEANEGSLSVLPIQCLCEFLLHRIASQSPMTVDKKGSKQDRKAAQSKLERIEEMKTRLRDALWDPSTDVDSVKQALVYFLGRLAADTTGERDAAAEALAGLLLAADDEESDVSAVVERLSRLPHFVELRPELCQKLCECCVVETDAKRVFAYAYFVMSHVETEGMHLAAAQLATLVVDRQRMADSLFAGGDGLELRDMLIEFFARYVHGARGDKADIEWSSKQDEMRVEWPGGFHAVLPCRCVNAIVLLLCRRADEPGSAQEVRADLMDMWFPSDAANMPTAYLMDTLEEAELTPDWLKLAMLRSADARLLEVALAGLEPSSALVFIQSFGLPVASASRLLTILDGMVVDKSNMVDARKAEPFVKAHRLRGAPTGQTFLSNLKKETIDANADALAVKAEEPIVVKMESAPLPSQSLAPSLRIEIPSEMGGAQVDDYLRQVFQPHSRLDARWTKFLSVMRTNSTVASVVQNALRSTIDLAFSHPMRLAAAIAAIAECANKNSNFSGEFEDFVQYLRQQKNLPAVIGNIISVSANEIANNDAAEIAMDTGEMEDPIAILQKLNSPDLTNDAVSMLVEQYRRLEPEIVGPGDRGRAEISLLFAKNSTRGHGHLAAALPHTVKMDTLRATLDCLLAKFDCNVNSTAVAELVFACLRSPRVWVGRDSNCPRHARPDDILALNEQQARSLAEYVVDELGRTPDDRPAIKRRVGLLIEVVPNTSILALIAERWSQLAASGDDGQKRAARALLSETRFRRPMLARQSDAVEKHDWDGHTETDALIYRLLGDLFTAAESHNTNDTIESLSVVLRQLANSHPTLVCRQLALLDAYLRGVVGLTMRRYNETNYRLVFTHVLKLLAALRPHIFDESLATALENILTSFFEFAKKHALRNRNLIDVLSDTLDLAVGYLETLGGSARFFLEGHGMLLQAIAVRYPDLRQPKVLLEELGISMIGIDVDALAELGGVDQGLQPIKIRPPSPIRLQQMAPVLRRLARSETPGDQAEAIREMQELTADRTDGTRLMMADLQRAFLSADARVRDPAFAIAIKLLRFSPHMAERVVPVFIVALQHPDSAIARTALLQLPEIASICRDHASELLEAGFRCAISSVMGAESARILGRAVAAVQLDIASGKSQVSI